MADDSPNAPTTFTLTSDQLQALARAITSAQPVPASANTQVPAPPPFTSTAEPAASSKSLYALFPNIEERHILDITRHDFRPYSLHKLDRRVRSKVDTSKGGLDALALSEGSVRDYPSLDSVVVPLLTYFNILIAYARMGGNPDAGCVLSMGANTYVASLTEMAKKFQWAAVFDLVGDPLTAPFTLLSQHIPNQSLPHPNSVSNPNLPRSLGNNLVLPGTGANALLFRGDPACKGKSASR
ncbi:hypothetical protein EV361DRAFT_941667 [Lentinula raphanica]|nr:hypothetical protein EV361DRAFT_941667 [Lentinula raphanica]